MVLMDMDLPAVDGLEATRRIKGDVPRTFVIMFASLDGLAFREASARSGADEFLPKFAPLPMILSTLRRSNTTKTA
jgi:DNA-binding NarL/FixJ family response regulator